MQKKVNYIRGFCQALRYNGLWALQVVRENEDELFHKDKMVCSTIASGQCKNDQCDVF